MLNYMRNAMNCKSHSDNRMNELYYRLLHSREKMESQASEGGQHVNASSIVAPASFVYYDIARDLGLTDEQAIAVAGHQVPDEVANFTVMVKANLSAF